MSILRARITSVATCNVATGSCLVIAMVIFMTRMNGFLRLCGDPTQTLKFSGKEQQQTSHSSSTVNILFGLSGDHPGFLAEFEVALKSVLMNAPINNPLHVYVMCDKKAHDALEEAVFEPANITSWVSVAPIFITTYNVESHLQEWKIIMKKTLRAFPLQAMLHHTVGAFFRLFSHQVLPQDVKHALYMDTDVVIFSNLQNIWKERDDRKYFTWGKSRCSGFALIHVKWLDDLWDKAAAINLTDVSARFNNQKPNDQLLFIAINDTYPEKVGLMSDGWELTVADGGWRIVKTLVDEIPDIGAIHFNGGGDSKEAYFETHSFVNDPQWNASWGLSQYFVRIPWVWARFQSRSNLPLGQMGYALELKHHPDDPQQ